MTTLYSCSHQVGGFANLTGGRYLPLAALEIVKVSGGSK